MSQTFEYKEYSGSILYSAEDKIFHGCFLGIRDAITYEVKDASQLETRLKAAVDEYLRFCEEEEKQPENWTLNGEDRDLFVKNLLHPPTPGARLAAAAQRYRKRVRS